MALTAAGSRDEAQAAADLIEIVESNQNAFALSYALLAYGYAFRESDPVRGRDALRRGLLVAQESDNRLTESILAMTLGRAEAEIGNPIAALDCARQSIANYYDAGNTSAIRVPLAWLAALFDRLSHHESAATVAGFAVSPMAEATIPELGTSIARLRAVLGDQTYETLAQCEQIDQARAELEQPD
jgi:hypothetical protein